MPTLSADRNNLEKGTLWRLYIAVRVVKHLFNSDLDNQYIIDRFKKVSHVGYFQQFRFNKRRKEDF